MTVLDTHVWVWWLSDPDRLSGPARGAIEQALEKRSLHVSSMSTWEVCLLVRRGRLVLTEDVANWIGRAEKLPFLEFVPVDNAIAYRSVFLKAALHADPADRIIVATTQLLNARLVTRDQRLLDFAGVRTIW